MNKKKENQYLTRQQMYEVMLEIEKRNRITPKSFVTREMVMKEDAVFVTEKRMEYYDNIAEELGFIK